MAAAAVAKMPEPKILVADNPTSQKGANAYHFNKDAHEAPLGAHTTNDAVEERSQHTDANARAHTHKLQLFISPSFYSFPLLVRSLFSLFPPPLAPSPLPPILSLPYEGISTESASGVAQRMHVHYFDKGDARTRRRGKKNGKAEQRDVRYLHTLPTVEQNATVLAAMAMRAAVRVEARADLAEQHQYFAMKCEQALQRQLDKLVTEYVKAMAANDKYIRRRDERR
eukprot:5520672-Pleurochrysis_carterae.AAC.2